ncbi:Uncharacterized conserved protein, AIM24 family [Seinonella peptonophila]|uniref:Uncharacterized conserved protein, AIM24 family n=1 Tax=Seinonella peptonophila TaxID=112248 RepID=A0A1M4VQ33_9BACL|nr:AIM24 family protein [Seinonella peptonophila]SHE71221.1 Uncharacterized conserved protein, AIM24 family [Seinonella peptonophila]
MEQFKYSLEEFLRQTGQKDNGGGTFELESPQTLEVNLNGQVWAKAGSMIAYDGDIRFKREGILDHGISNLIKRSISGEGTQLMNAEGYGSLYLADYGKNISILNLQNDSLYVNGNDVLAFEPTLKWDIKMMRKVAGMLQGGLFNVRFDGTGMVAITSHHRPLTLVVTPNHPVVTDPNATVAWSGSLTPEFKTDISLRTLLGRGSGETFQMRFEGNGFVVVQPYEEIYMQGRA